MKVGKLLINKKKVLITKEMERKLDVRLVRGTIAIVIHGTKC